MVLKSLWSINKMIKNRISIAKLKQSDRKIGNQNDRHDHFSISCDDEDLEVVSEHFNYISSYNRISDNWVLNEIQTKFKFNLYEAFILFLNYFKSNFPEIQIKVYDWNSKEYLKETV